ncbi:hypothetical protein NKDENANG_00991 [Candidatus Entotheonellaceae bacterium PAL068K]
MWQAGVTFGADQVTLSWFRPITTYWDPSPEVTYTVYRREGSVGIDSLAVLDDAGSFVIFNEVSLDRIPGEAIFISLQADRCFLD